MATKIISGLFRSTKQNAKVREINFQLTISDVENMFASANGRCTLTGIEFDTSPPNGRKRPYASSIDRIDSNIGYTVPNCRLICVAMNLAMNWYGESVFNRISHAYINNKRNEPNYKNSTSDKFGSPLIGIRVSKTKNGLNTYTARICIYGKKITIGTYDTEHEASTAYASAVKRRKEKYAQDQQEKIHEILHSFNNQLEYIESN